ncbi:activating transcription factor 7-interacting protein 2 isoform X2 [Cavia porcellus]|uniref:activating transcription factor 7-interacting protein 2 isoform X2 n=1 Tax=Cavia porcellus TaxID=10141 RepID=UPI002FE2A4F0
MASLDRSKRRILKAKKTMPPSCRRQAEILNKSKTIEVLKTATINSNVPSNNQNLSTEVITGECVRPEIVDSSLDSKINSAFLLNSIAFPQNLIKPVEKFVHSETRFDEQIVCSYKKPRKAIDSSSHFFIQEVKEQWNTSETHFEYKANVTSSYFQDEQNCNLKSICHSPTMLRDLVQNPLDNNRINKMASNLEVNSSSDSYDEMQNDILSSSSCYMPVVKTPNLVNLVISNNCASNTLKTKESSKTQHSSISDVENTESKWQCLLNTGGNNSYNQKKMFSENKENVKHMKTSEQINENICVALERQTAVLEQVKHLIQQEIYSINFKLFDKKVKELNERIKKTQCRQKHEAIAGELFARVSKLQKRVKAVLAFQRRCMESKTSNNTPFKIENSETMTLNKSQESVHSRNEILTSVNCEPSNPSEKASEKLNLSSDGVEFVCESNDDVMWISVESPNLTTPVTPNARDSKRITSANSNISSNDIVEVRDLEKRKCDFVIDLTKEGPSTCKTESPVFSLESPSKAALNSREITPVAESATEIFRALAIVDEGGGKWVLLHMTLFLHKIWIAWSIYHLSQKHHHHCLSWFTKSETRSLPRSPS